MIATVFAWVVGIWCDANLYWGRYWINSSLGDVWIASQWNNYRAEPGPQVETQRVADRADRAWNERIGLIAPRIDLKMAAARFDVNARIPYWLPTMLLGAVWCFCRGIVWLRARFRMTWLLGAMTIAAGSIIGVTYWVRAGLGLSSPAINFTARDGWLIVASGYPPRSVADFGDAHFQLGSELGFVPFGYYVPVGAGANGAAGPPNSRSSQLRIAGVGAAPSVVFRVPMWMAWIFLAIGTVWSARRAMRSPEANDCAQCGYDLTGNESGVCSECGAEIPKTESLVTGNK